VDICWLYIRSRSTGGGDDDDDDAVVISRSAKEDTTSAPGGVIQSASGLILISCRSVMMQISSSGICLSSRSWNATAMVTMALRRLEDTSRDFVFVVVVPPPAPSPRLPVVVGEAATPFVSPPNTDSRMWIR